MAQNAHTPGPWTVDPNGSYINYHNEVVGTSFFLIHERFVDEFKKEQAANMALISAAPDMLDALKVILNSYESMFEILTDKQKKEYIIGFNGLPSVKKARAAIAKATGYKQQCDKCNGHGEVEKTIYRGDEGMEIEMDVTVECSECDGYGNV